MRSSKVSLVLASASPRRKQLLQQLGWPFETVCTDIDESVHCEEAPLAYVERLARCKAEAAIGGIRADLASCLLLGSDTTVAMKSKIFGKPTNQHEALNMLRGFSGNWHNVHTAVSAILILDDEQVATETIAVSTAVKFRQLSLHEMEAYVASDEPFDKAGGYGIQGDAAKFVERIEGSYTAVVGLPLSQTYELVSRVLRLAD